MLLQNNYVLLLLNIPRYKALAQAKKQGYVQIKINYPEDSAINLEGRLEERFGLKEAVIASSLNENDLKEEIAFFASDYLLRTLKNHMTIALTRGVTLQNMVEFLGKDVRLKFLKTDDVNVVPLMAERIYRFQWIRDIEWLIQII